MEMEEQEQEFLIIFMSKKLVGQAQSASKLWVSMKKGNRLFQRDLIRTKINIGRR